MVVLQPGLRARDEPGSGRATLALPQQLRARAAVPGREPDQGALATAAGRRSAAGRAQAAGVPGRRLRGNWLMTHDRSGELFARARTVTPGGVNSPVRAFGAVGGTPVFMASGSGAYLTDTAGRSYLDLGCSWGPLILGHAQPAVIGAVREAAGRGPSFGAVTVAETDL